MTYKELFEAGQNFEDYIKISTIKEEERIPKNYSRITVSEEIKEEINNIVEEIYIVASGEMWCPDCQLNITVAKKLTELNKNIKLSIIPLGRGRVHMAKLLEIERAEFKLPTMVVLDKNFEKKGIFIEKPKKAKLLEDTPENNLLYLKGNLLGDTVEELVKLMTK